MKTFAEYMSTLNEASDDMKKFLELNKGREGKTLIDLNGKEHKDSFYLGKGYYADKKGQHITIYPPETSKHRQPVVILADQFAVLKKVF